MPYRRITCRPTLLYSHLTNISNRRTLPTTLWDHATTKTVVLRCLAKNKAWDSCTGTTLYYRVSLEIASGRLRSGSVFFCIWDIHSLLLNFVCTILKTILLMPFRPELHGNCELNDSPYDSYIEGKIIMCVVHITEGRRAYRIFT